MMLLQSRCESDCEKKNEDLLNLKLIHFII